MITKSAFSSIFLAFFFQVVLSQNDPTVGAKLLLVVETFRHGARQREFNSSYPDSTPLKDYGELTAEGEREHYVLGQTMRQKYADSDIKFPLTYDHTWIHAKSTDVNRTIMSAYSHLAGMFPLQNGYDLTDINSQFLIPPFENLNTNGLDKFSLPQGQQPIPVHVKSKQSEQQLLGYSSAACSNQATWQNANINDPDWNFIKGQFADVISKLAAIKEFQLPANPNLDIVAELVDTLISAKWKQEITQITQLTALIDGFTLSLDDMILPENKNRLWVQMNLLYTLQMHLLLFKTPQQKATTVTPYFNELLAYFNNTLTSTDNSYFKWIMLSAHDTTIAMISVGMNFTSWECIARYQNGTLPEQSTCIYLYPGFASNIIFELYEDAQKKPFIKALYNGTAMPLCSTTNTYCYLNVFSEIVNNYVVENYDEACGNDLGIDTQNSIPTWAIVVLAVFGSIMIALGITVIVLKLKMNKLQQVTKNSAYSQI